MRCTILTCLVLTLLLASSSLAQVFIRERIGIDPKRPAMKAASATTNTVSTIKLEATFAGGVRSGTQYPRGFGVSDGCGVQTNLDFPGSASVEVQARSGFTQGRISFYPSSVGQMTLTWSVEGTVLRSEVSTISCTNCRVDLQPYFQLYTGFSFDMEVDFAPFTVHGNSRAISVSPIDGGICKTPVWAPALPVTLTIIGGQQFGSFHKANGDSLGTSVTVRGYEISDIRYVADGVQPDSILGQVSVQASSGGITQQVSFSVLRTAPSPTWLRLRTIPDISFGGERTIAADAIDWFLDPVSLPSTVTYTFEIIGGAEWGTLVRGSKSGDAISGVPQFSSRFVGSQGFVFFQVRDREPTQPQLVTIKVSASDTAVKPASSSFKVVPSPFIVRANPNPVSFGASSLIEPEIKINDTTFIPFPADANLYYEIVKGQGIGTLQTPDSQFTGGSISGQYQHMRFNAGPQGSLPDSQEVWVWVIVNNGGSGQGNLNNKQGLGKLLVVKGEKHEILLGETKYYQAKIDGEKLKIEELAEPILNGGIAADVWGSDPVSIESGDKLGVYWEKKYPVYASPTFAGMVDLPEGVIRLVGRYWEQGKTYKVKLKASHEGKTGESVIEVKKPGKLGTTRSKSKDVFDNEINIDELCMKYGGQYGIPPQLIKGQIEQEAGTYDFGGGTGLGFAPSYRYEPYTVQFWKGVRTRAKNSFFVSETNVNDPAVPQHVYVQDYLYPYPNKTVWDMIYDHSQLVNNIPDKEHRVYGVRKADGTMNFLPYRKTQKQYQNFLEEFLQKNYPLTEASVKANEKMVVYLRDKWDGGVKDGTKGLKNIKAQTRIASSYGLLQMLYTTALQRGYPENRDHLPESLNETDTILNLSVKYQKGILRERLSFSAESGNDWPQGYENGFYLFVYPNWNTQESYPAQVIRKSRSYLPKK